MKSIQQESSQDVPMVTNQKAPKGGRPGISTNSVDGFVEAKQSSYILHNEQKKEDTTDSTKAN